MKKLKLCKDCIWADVRTQIEYKECLCPKQQFFTNPVTGEKERRWTFCTVQREDSCSCGEKARWFEPKKKTRLKK